MFGLVWDSYTYYRALTILAGHFFDLSDESFLCDESNDKLINLSYKSQNFVLFCFVLFFFLFYLNMGQAFQGQLLEYLGGPDKD